MAAQKVIVIVSGGLVQDVVSVGGSIAVEVYDFDNLAEDPVITSGWDTAEVKDGHDFIAGVAESYGVKLEGGY